MTKWNRATDYYSANVSPSTESKKVNFSYLCWRNKSIAVIVMNKLELGDWLSNYLKLGKLSQYGVYIWTVFHNTIKPFRGNCIDKSPCECK